MKVTKIILGILIAAGLFFVSGLMTYRYYSQSCMIVSVYGSHAYCQQDSRLIDSIMVTTLMLCIPLIALVIVDRKK